MTPPYTADVLLVTPAAYRAAAAALVAQVTGNPHDTSPESFGVALTALDGAQITHYAARTRVREQTLVLLPTLAQAIPGALWTVMAHDDDTDEQRAARLSVDAWLTTQGLALHTPDEDDDG